MGRCSAPITNGITQGDTRYLPGRHGGAWKWSVVVEVGMTMAECALSLDTDRLNAS